MNPGKPLLFWKRGLAGSSLVLAFLFTVAVAQDTPIPIKLGLWETTVSSTNEMALPPEAEARIAAMPAAQQAQVRSMMGGGTPVTSTHKSCVATQTTMDALLNKAQERPGVKCTFTNKKQTENSASFDTSCVTQQGTMTGHSEFRMADSDHVSGTTHMTGSMTSPRGGTMTMNITSTSSSKYLGADCGDVKPYTPAEAGPTP